MNTLGNRIRLLRLTKGFTEALLAEKLHTQTGVVSNWETGHFLPRPRYILRLAQVLDVEPKELAELWMADSLAREDTRKEREDK